MSRSRRGYRRSVSQRAAGLLALALPAPISRLVDTQIGPFLILIGVPVLIVTGLLRVNFRDGVPTFTFNAQRESEFNSQVDWGKNYFREWGQRAQDSYMASQHHLQQGYPYGGPQPNYAGPYGQSSYPSTDPGFRSQLPQYAPPSYGQPSGYGNYGTGYSNPQGGGYGQPPSYQNPGGYYGGPSTYRQSASSANYPTYPQQGGYQNSQTYGGYLNRSSSVDVNRGRY